MYGGEGSDFLTLTIEPANISDLYVYAEGLADDQTTIIMAILFLQDVFSVENFDFYDPTGENGYSDQYTWQEFINTYGDTNGPLVTDLIITGLTIQNEILD